MSQNTITCKVARATFKSFDFGLSIANMTPVKLTIEGFLLDTSPDKIDAFVGALNVCELTMERKAQPE